MKKTTLFTTLAALGLASVGGYYFLNKKIKKPETPKVFVEEQLNDKNLFV